MIERLARPSTWPVVVKVPVLVALLMVTIGAVLTNQVLDRLAESQQRHFDELAAAYFDGLSSSVIPAVLREDSWETFDILDRARTLYHGLTVLETVVVGGDGLVLAASNPKAVPTTSRVPSQITARFGADSDAWLDARHERAGVRRALLHQNRTIGAIYAEFDIGKLYNERRIVLWTLVGTNFVITMLVALAGFLLVLRLLRPVRILTRHLRRGVTGPVPPLAEEQVGPQRSEFGGLLRHYNAMVKAWNEREVLAARTAEEDRLTSLGRLASGMAHEINNPLGGLFNAIEALKRHGHDAGARERAVSLLERGLLGIRDVVRSALATYRVDAPARQLKAADIDDLRLLIAPEVDRRGLDLVWRNDLPNDLPCRAGPVRQAVLNLLLNACQASPASGAIGMTASRQAGSLVIRVVDQGPGLDPKRARYLEGGDLVAAPCPGEPGLGLWIIRRLVGEAGGIVRVEWPAAGGTAIVIAIPDATEEGVRHVA